MIHHAACKGNIQQIDFIAAITLCCRMRNVVILIIVLALLYLIPALTLQFVYGPSYDLMGQYPGWEPDGARGWQPEGVFRANDSLPEVKPPTVVSYDIPPAFEYMPIFLPAIVLLLFLFTPMRRLIERQPPPDVMEPLPDEPLPGAPGNDPDDTRS